jgi:adenylate cyclase
VDDYMSLEPGPRSERTFAEFAAAAGPRGALLPDVYEVLGLPEPDPASPINVDEEDLFGRFLEGWSVARSDESLVRAARLIAEGTRVATLGWAELLDEEVARPARERLLRGEVDRFPVEASQAIAKCANLAPRMVEWLSQRYLEQRSVAGIVEGFERFLASRDLAPPPPPTAPPAVVFVDLTGYTRLTEERGDETAVRLATMLQRQADAVAGANGGRLVKLLGDGAMLRFPDASRGLEAALDLVGALGVGGDLVAHAASTPVRSSSAISTCSGGPSTWPPGSPRWRARARCW